MEKNFVEKVTNLEREKIKYVPKRFLDEALDTLWNNTGMDAETLEEENEIDSYIHNLKKQADEESKELPIIDDDNKKSDISVCPYCGGKMILNFCEGYRGVNSYYTPINRSRNMIRGGDAIQYKCCYCGASSPNVYLRISLIDEKELKNDIKEEITAAVEEIKREEEGEYDD